jgi:hypothetical protein
MGCSPIKEGANYSHSSKRSGSAATRVTSCHAWWANQFRLLLSSLAYVLLEALRRLGLKRYPVGACSGWNHPLAPTENRRGHHPKHPARSIVVDFQLPTATALLLLLGSLLRVSFRVVLTPAPENNGGFGGASSDAAPAASFSRLFGKTLCHRLFTYPASAPTTIWCKKRR